MTTMEDVMEVRTEFEFNVTFVREFMAGTGYDMGCGSCPLIHEDCHHFDISPQPLAIEQVGNRFMQLDCFAGPFSPGVDFIFSSHMVEDLPTEAMIISCINYWGTLLNDGGYLILLLPDMQGGRYPTVEEGGNPSHRVNVGVEFINKIMDKLPELTLFQIDTIPHDKSCTIDVVFKKEG